MLCMYRKLALSACNVSKEHCSIQHALCCMKHFAETIKKYSNSTNLLGGIAQHACQVTTHVHDATLMVHHHHVVEVVLKLLDDHHKDTL